MMEGTKDQQKDEGVTRICKVIKVDSAPITTHHIIINYILLLLRHLQNMIDGPYIHWKIH